jgi:DNA-binding IclR family transcriptional regulator
MPKETVQTVTRALNVLRAFSRERPDMSVAELTRRLDLPRTIVLRLLNTLENAGYVERVADTSHYRIGLAALELGALYLADNPLIVKAADVLDDLARQTGYTAYLGALDRGNAVILALREGRRPVRFVWSIGDRLPATTTAFGKAMLMHMDGQQVDEILGHDGDNGDDRLTALTERSIKTRMELGRQLEQARTQGWIVAQDESYPGVSAVGSAIVNAEGCPVAGVSVSFLTYPPNPPIVEQFGRLTVDAAHTLSRRLAVHHLYGQRNALTATIPTALTRQRRSMEEA